MAIVKIAGIILLLVILISIFYDKNFFEDTVDWANNLFSPPEIDPTRTHVKKFENRAEAREVEEDWLSAYERVINSNEYACYEDLPNIPQELAQEGYFLEITSSKKDEIIIQTKNEGFPITERTKINTGLCMVLDKNQDMLENFQENLIKKYEPKKCTLTKPCGYFFLKDQGTYQTNPNQAYVPEDASAEQLMQDILKITGGVILQIPNPQENKKSSATSMNLQYIKVENNNPEIIINTTTNDLSTNRAFKLIKINDNICVLPIDKSNNEFEIRGSKNNRIHYLTEKSLLLNIDYPGMLPKCEKTYDDLREHINTPITIRIDRFNRLGRVSYNYDLKYIYEINQNKWNITFVPGSGFGASSSSERLDITKYLETLLKDKLYPTGVRELCEQTPLDKEFKLIHTDGSEEDYKIGKIEGLRCELITRNPQTQPANQGGTI